MPVATLLEFPCQFPIKVFGEDHPEFDALVFALVSAHVPDLPSDAVTRHRSRQGRYVALTVTITATSKDQLDSIYRALSSHSQVLMAL